jgi:hypothetical protein
VKVPRTPFSLTGTALVVLIAAETLGEIDVLGGVLLPPGVATGSAPAVRTRSTTIVPEVQAEQRARKCVSPPEYNLPLAGCRGGRDAAPPAAG